MVDCTREGRTRAWFAGDQEETIDWLHLREEDEPDLPDDPQQLKRAVIRLRPRATRALLRTNLERRAQGSRGRLVIWVVGDLADPLSRALLLDLPLDLSNLIFWESGFAPAVLRVALAAEPADRRTYLSLLRPQYWDLPNFSRPYYGEHQPEQVYGNEFDATLVGQSESSLRKIVEHLVPLHVRETQYARAHLDGQQSGGLIVIEQALQASRAWRGVDWLALALYPYFPRLWDAERDDLLEVLDFERCQAREQDPWAAVKALQRETDWSTLGLDPSLVFDLYAEEDSYRISPGDYRTRLPLTRFLYERRHYQEALTHCVLGSEECASFEPAWLKLEGLVRLALGESRRGRELLTSYRDGLRADPEPTPLVMDEVATMALVLRQWDEARGWAMKALEADPGLLHAYDTLVLCARASGNEDWEEEARQLAEDRGLQIPLHAREQTQRVLREARRRRGAGGDPKPRKWWQFWRSE